MAIVYKQLRDVDGEISEAIQITRDGVISVVSANPDNRDYSTYQTWLNERVDPEDPESALVGNQPEPAE